MTAALYCASSLSVWRLLAATCCYCCCLCLAVIFCLTGQTGAAWQDCYCVAEHWVKGEERFKDLRLFQRRTGHPLLHVIYNLLKAACVVGNETMLILECKNTSNEAKSGPLLLGMLAQQLRPSRVGVWVTCVTAAFQWGFGPSDWPAHFLSFLFPETCWTRTHFLSQIHVSTKQKPFWADMDVCLYIYNTVFSWLFI